MPYDRSNHHRDKRGRTAAEREAEHILTESLAAARNETEAPSTPFETVKSRVGACAHAGDLRTRLPLRVLAAITLHRKLSIGLATAGLVAVFLTLVPFSYERTVGYELIAAWATEEGPASDVGDATNREVADADENAADSQRVIVREPAVRLIVDSAPTPKVTHVAPRVTVGEETGQLVTPVGAQLVAVTVDNSPRVVLRAAAETLKVRSPSGATPARVVVRPIVKKESASLYSRAKTDLFVQTPEDEPRLPKEVFESLLDDLDLENLSDAELREELNARLAARGLSHYRVHISSDLSPGGSGERRMAISVSADDDDLHPDVVSTTSLLDALLDGLDLQDPDITDAQLKTMIEERLSRSGKKGARVEIYTDWDGQRQAKIWLERVDEDD